MCDIDDDDEDEHYCQSCNGTGEGQWDGASCSSCGGSGFDRGDPDPDDFDIPDDWD